MTSGDTYSNREKAKQAWLDNLKAGDEVAVNHYGHTYMFIKVERTTKTRIILHGGSCFHRIGGMFRGEYNQRLEEPTLTLKVNIQAAARARRNLSLIEKVKWSNVDRDLIERILAMLPDQP